MQWELPSDLLLPVSTGFQRPERLQGESRQVEDIDAVHGPVLGTSGLCLTFFCLRASQGEKGKRGIDGVDGMKVSLRQEGWEGGVCRLGWEVDRVRGCPKCTSAVPTERFPEKLGGVSQAMFPAKTQVLINPK